MIVPDVNLLVYAYNSDAPHHAAARPRRSTVSTADLNDSRCRRANSFSLAATSGSRVMVVRMEAS